MRVTREQAAANRERILEVAGTLFRQHGYDGIGVAEITVRLQPNSLSSGMMRMPGVARIPAVTSSTPKVTSATTQA